jgi:multiple sugar transport system substrate-binding protein
MSETQKANYHPTALLAAQASNNVTKQRSFYGVPVTSAVVPIHIWRSLVEKAGYQMSDLPKTWDAFFDFFKEVQKKLRAQGMRKVYGLGFQVTANGNDPNALYYAFLIGYGGQNIFTQDGKAHFDDPQVKEAAIKALSYLTRPKEGYVPPSAINWNDGRQQRLPRATHGDGCGLVAVVRCGVQGRTPRSVLPGYRYPGVSAEQ